MKGKHYDKQGQSLARARRTPRLSDAIASDLREQILNGSLEDGQLLARQEDLLAQFQVSPPVLREALRILEAEGLVTVLRGKVGGAVVHAPGPEHAAFAIARMLQSRGTSLDDVARAIQALEPLCVEMAARRVDRHDEIVPEMRELLEREAAVLGDPEAFRAASGEIHGAFVRASGNETMAVLVGALVALWASHSEARARSGEWLRPVTQSARESFWRNHTRIVDTISVGDAEAAARLARQHLREAAAHALSGDDDPVQAALLS